MSRRLKMGLANFMSRKLWFSMFSVFAIIYCVVHSLEIGMPASVLVVVLPTVIVSITVICVTYVSGLAKIDIQAIASVSASASATAGMAKKESE